VLDDKLQLASESRLARTTSDAPVVVFTSGDADTSRATALVACGVEIVRLPSDSRDLHAVLANLGERAVQSVLVEGGATVAGRLVDAGLVDKVTFFIAPLVIGGRDAPAAVGGAGVEKLADAMRLRDVEITRRGEDVEITGYPKGEPETGDAKA
jgi:diaminohydroxyphosphoribosylaminopyrimidine deaminase/5-amino-6-(5-phosphoribosylamino)uracil reductase